MLAAVVMTALNLRTAVTGFSPLLVTIGDDLGFDTALFGVFGTIVTASFAVFGFVAASLSRRAGLEATLGVATLLTTLGILFRALSPNPPTLVLSAVVAFAGVGMSNVLIVPIVKRYFPHRLRAASSLYIALLQFGQFAAPLVAVPVALIAGWRVAAGVWAVLTAVACLLWAAVVVTRSRGRAAGSDPARGTAPGAAGDPARAEGVWRSPVLWAMVLMFGMTSLNTYAIITWLPTILVDAGADPLLSGALLALFSVFGLGAAFVVPPLTLGLRRPGWIVIVCVALLGIGYLGLVVAPLAGAVFWVVCLGLGVSTFPMCLTLVNARTSTTAGSATLSGAMQGIGYGIACVGPLAIGLLHEAEGDWDGAYLLLFASLAVLLVSGMIACRPRILEVTVQA